MGLSMPGKMHSRLNTYEITGVMFTEKQAESDLSKTEFKKVWNEIQVNANY